MTYTTDNTDTLDNRTQQRRKLTEREHNLLALGYQRMSLAVELALDHFRAGDFGELNNLQRSMARKLAANAAVNDRQKFTVLVLATTAFPEGREFPSREEFTRIMPLYSHTDTSWLVKDDHR